MASFILKKDSNMALSVIRRGTLYSVLIVKASKRCLTFKRQVGLGL